MGPQPQFHLQFSAQIPYRTAGQVKLLTGYYFLTITSSTYTDAVGWPEGSTVVPAGDPSVGTWPSQPKIPLRSGIQPFTQNIPVYVDGFALNPAIANRTVNGFGDGQSVTSPPVTVTITWP